MKLTLKLGLTSVLASTLLAGCSDYPDNGTVDTQIFSDKFDVIALRGDVYGIPTGTSDLVRSFNHDRYAVRSKYGDDDVSYPDRVFLAIQSGEPMPDLELQFPAVDGLPDMSGVDTAIQEEVRAYIERTKAEVAEEIEAAGKAVSENETEIKKLTDQIAAFEGELKKRTEAVNTARENLNSAIENYNGLQKQSLEELNAIVEKHGSGNRYRRNPITSYRLIDFADKKKPAVCPTQRRHVAVDMMAEWDKCIYIRDLSGNRYGSAEKTVANLAKKYLLEIDAMGAKIGERGGWSSSASGLYASLGTAKEKLSELKRNRAEGFVYPAYAKRRIEGTQRQLQRAKERLAEVKDPEYLATELWDNGQMPDYRREVSEEHSQLLAKYTGAMRDHIDSQYVKVTSLKFNEKTEDGDFTDFSGDFEGVGVAAEIVASRGSRREATTLMIVQSLLDPVVAEAEKLTLKFDKDSLERFDPEKPESIMEEFSMRLIKSPFEEPQA